MRVRNISPDRWPMFFDDFTHLHEGKHVNVESMGSGFIGVQSQFHDKPLAAIVPNPIDQDRENDEWIEIIAGNRPEGHVSFSIAQPSAVLLAEEEDGRAIALQIESANGVITMLRFEPPSENFPEGFMIS